MKTRPQTPEFARVIAAAITDYKLDKQVVADGARMHKTTLYRYLKGIGPSKGATMAILGSINRLAGREAVPLAEGMKLAGFETYDARAVDGEYVSGPGTAETVAQIIDRVSSLPLESQRDVLSIVNALYDRHRVK